MEGGDRGEEAFIAKFTGPQGSASRTKYNTTQNPKQRPLVALSCYKQVSLSLFSHLFASITSNLNCISMKLNSYT